MAPINVTTSRQQIQASVAEDKISANVSAGFGAAGPAATITVGTVTTGAPGSSASVVNVGTSSAAVLDFTIPAGATGAAGPAGANGQPGATGPAGAAATVSVGTVTTGAAGSSASVTNVGSSSAAVLDFTIPAGATGATGPQGPTGPAGTTTWAGITDKPSFAAVATSGSASDLSTGTLNASRLPASVVRTGVPASGNVQVNGNLTVVNSGGEDPSLPVIILSDGVDYKVGLAPDGSIFCSSIALGGTDLATTLSGKAASSHAHGSITNSGAIGTTSGLIVTTGASGVLGALAQGTAGQVLKVNSGATGVEWGAAAADVSIDTTAADILSASSGSITADDPGADRLVFWDDSAGKLTHLTVGSGLSISGTTLSSTASGTKSFAKFTPADNNPPATNFATLDTRNSVLVLEFDAATDESAVFVGYIPEGATLTNGLKVRLSWMADTATSGNVRWGVQFEADGTDLDSDSYDTATLVTSAANGTSGIETVAEITATSIDSLAAGDRFRLKVYRDADDATNDTMTGDAQLVAVEVQVA